MKQAWLLLALPALAIAAHADPAGGFNGPGERSQPITVAEAGELPDESGVTLAGYITKSLGDEMYEFQDDTGTLVVEIDDDEWHGAEVTPSDRVEVSGEIDREWRETGVDVDSIRLAQGTQ